MTETSALPAVVDIQAAIAPLPVLKGRRPDSPASDTDPVFATLARSERCGIYAGSFEGESAWERHSNGDEFVQVIAGETLLTILTDAGRAELRLGAGMVTMVPRGCWHKFQSPAGVTVLTMTPTPTDHSMAEDPRAP
ncbi:cupin domain-containing protein [Oceanibacterium hippocampi]|uniref:Cupin domain protein n=1 Tax=Oceanibacterium hippocampi TaxID=745714 RepID=A0A1Y5TVJ5_9PROT|nr:cupin domain-containing protein [Oceanibacterium hippocampi]SLN69434.1 Cupin domain protein [Oceanibacterium hippocampi]